MCIYIEGKEIKRFFSRRFTGEINESIKNIKVILSTISSPPPPDYDFWLLWYKSFLKYELNFHRTFRFIPGKFLEQYFKHNALNSITDGDKLILKDINLPLPLNNYDKRLFTVMIMDSLLPYLLSNLDENLLYSLIIPHMEGPYEYKAVRLEKNDIVIDAGANIGDFSALSSVKGCKAYAFEPIPYIIEKYLSKTAKLNPNITICPYAISDRRGELFFSESTALSASASFVLNENINKQIKVQAIDLDTFAQENNLPSIDFIKADIEGSERYMLMGARKVLKEYAPKISICTYHLPDDPKVLRELILDANPNYIIEERWKKMYAYVPK